MGYFDAIILGIVQGLTEFLPISSSGHLVIFQHLMNINIDNISFEVFVHFGTLLSVVVVYFTDIVQMINSFFKGVFNRNIKTNYRNDPYFRLSIFVIVGTIPAVFAGLLLEDFFVSIFHDINLVGVTLLITGTTILSTRFIKEQNREMNSLKALGIGLVQSIAILPGISRSGFTISAGLFTGLSRENAARYSFLLAIPAILGATLLHVIEMIKGGAAGLSNIGPTLIGSLASFIVGYLAIRWLLSVIKSGKFVWFAPYCFAAGLIILLFLS